MIKPKRFTHYIICVVSLMLTMGNSFAKANTTTTETDLLVVGGGASGVSAAVQASRMGIETLIVEESTWLGGMLTAAGVSAIDGNYGLRAGFWGEFLDQLVNHYGSYEALKTGWVSNVQFEPSVGNNIMKAIVAKEKNLSVTYGFYPVAVKQNEDKSWTLTAQNDKNEQLTVHAKFIIDATELGDVAKMAGIKYDVGMEARANTGEDIAPEVSNNIVQDITYVATLKDYGKDVSISKPEGYNPQEYAGCCINPLCINPKEPDRLRTKEDMMTYGALPNNKYMINWPIEGNDFYVNLIDMTRSERIEALKAAKQFTMGYIYFIQHELGYKNLGLADDEYPTTDKLPFIPYHRESRRIHGDIRFNYNYAKAPYAQPLPLYRTNIAVGDYPVDHHHTRYTGYEQLPRLYFHPIPSFGLPLGTIIPQGYENILVAEKSISVSNIINGTTRLQPVVLQIGTAAGTLAALSLRNNLSTHKVSVRDVQNAILASGGYLQPYLDAEKGTEMFATLQRIGSTGILKGVGRKVDWTNQFWLRADTTLLQSELEGLQEVYPYCQPTMTQPRKAVTVGQALDLVHNIAVHEGIMNKKAATKATNAAWLKLTNHTAQADKKQEITRAQYAYIIDKVLDPFNRKPVDIEGHFIQH